LAIVLVSGLAGIIFLPLLGARLLPDFRENYLIAHASLRPGISLAETTRVGGLISKGLMAIPGVKSVAEQIGRAENGQDPDAPNKSEFEVQIDPRRATAQPRSMRRSAMCSMISESTRGNLFGARRAHRRDACPASPRRFRSA
jgi:Cu/Ag efflux pump CusA